MISHAAEGSRPGRAVDPVETLAALRTIPDVRDAVVTERVAMDGHTMILGYVTGPDPKLGTAGIRQHLLTRLPDYLIPEHLAVLDELPLTPEGDYDLNALPEPDAEGSQVASYVAPRTPLEHQLVEIMKEFLSVDRIGVHDSFFALGGSSLQATQLARRIREIFDVELLLPDVFASPTVDGLAQMIVQTLGERLGVKKLKTQRWRRVGPELEKKWRSFHSLLPLWLRRWVPPGVPCGRGAPPADGTPGDQTVVEGKATQ